MYESRREILGRVIFELELPQLPRQRGHSRWMILGAVVQ